MHIQTEMRGDLAQRQAIVEVTDQGPGVLPEILPRIFERFAKAGVAPGLGLGLCLAHRIALAHGGALTVSSIPGSGATFRLSLPIGLAQKVPDARLS